MSFTHTAQVSIFSGNGDVTIKVADHGGGISPECLNRVWDYAYTTVQSRGPSSSQGMQPNVIEVLRR